MVAAAMMSTATTSGHIGDTPLVFCSAQKAIASTTAPVSPRARRVCRPSTSRMSVGPVGVASVIAAVAMSSRSECPRPGVTRSRLSHRAIASFVLER